MSINKEIQDAWLKGTKDDEYIKLINGAFGVQKNPTASKLIEPVQIIEKREEEKKKYILEEEKVGGENYYILKLGKIGGKQLERPVLFRKTNLIQIKESGNKFVEKDLGKIQKLEKGENKFKGKHANKIVFIASVQKEGTDKPRQIYILCENQTISGQIQSHIIQNKVLKSFAPLKQDIAPRFKYFLANRFRQSIKSYTDHLKAQEEKNKSQKKKTFENIFKGFDKKCISEVIQKWKQESQLAEKAERDTKLKEEIKLRNQEKERRWNILRSSEVLKQVDIRQLSIAMKRAIFSARQKQIEEEEALRAERVKRTKNDKKLYLQFSQLVLSQTLRMVRPILDVYYIVNKNIVKYDQYENRNETAYLVNHGQQATPSELVRKINDKEFQQKNPEQDELFQMVFTAKMHSKMSDNSYLWNLQPYDGFQTTSQQLQDDTIKFGDLDQCEKDTLKISLYDEMNRQKQFITYVTVSDLISAQTTTKQIWLNFSLESIKNYNTKILLKANIFRTPTIKSQVHSSFDDFLDIFGSKQFEMVDPIYLICLKNLSLIRSSWIYFLEKLIEEGLGSNSSIKLLQFLIDAIEQKDQVQYPQDISDPLIYKDFRKIFYESTSMYLTSAYAKTVLLQEDHQQELLEKIGEPDSKYIHKIIKEIQKTKTQISYDDLKRLFIYGVPSRFRCLYWSNFLQINNIIQEDIQKINESQVKDSDDLVKRYLYYYQLPEIDCSKSFLDQDEYEIMGKQHAENFESILSAFTSYLKYHRIVDLTYEDRLRYNLYRFIQRIYICLYPTFMKTEDNLHASFFSYDKQKAKLQMSLKKIDLNDFTEDEQKQKEKIIRAEIFWFSVAFYNLYFKQLVVMENEQGLQAMKKRIAAGIVAYENMLNPHSKLMIQQNQLQDSIKYQWFKQSTNFFQNTFQSFNFTKILDIVVFEFGMNLMDGFENAILACFITLLDRIKLDGIINQSQLENAFIIEGLFLQQSFFVDLYKNIQTIQKGFDPQLIEIQIHNLNFNQFGDLYLPQEKNEENLKIDKEILETLQTSHNRTLDLANYTQGNEAGQQPQNLSPQKKQKIVNVKSPFQVRKDFVEYDSEDEKDKLNHTKNYLVSYKVKIDEETLNKKNEAYLPMIL